LPNRSYGKISTMARKRKAKRFSAVDEVKAIARERIGAPPPEKIVPNRKKNKKEKHKPTLENFLQQS
jgi:hypothetical protein